MINANTNILEDSNTMAHYLQYLKACEEFSALPEKTDSYSTLLRMVCAARVALVDFDLNHQ